MELSEVRAVRRTWQVGRAFLKIDTGAGGQSDAPSSIAGLVKATCQIGMGGVGYFESVDFDSFFPVTKSQTTKAH
jgi:hypothetical protein